MIRMIKRETEMPKYSASLRKNSIWRKGKYMERLTVSIFMMISYHLFDDPPIGKREKKFKMKHYPETES